ncbi:sterol carrier protein domain-containing protein [Paenibacillus rhizoplanae]
MTFNVPEGDRERLLYIEDKHASWNNGLWRWNVSEQGEATFTQIQGERSEADLECSIGTLTVLLMGYKRPHQAARYGQLSGTAEATAWLEALIPQAETALFDFFLTENGSSPSLGSGGAFLYITSQFSDL